MNNQQVNNNGCQHVQLGGVAFYDEGKCFMFSPENEGVRNKVVGVFRSGGDTLTGMFLDLGSLWLVSIPLTLLAARVFHLPFLGVVITAYLGEDIPKSLLCLWHFVSMRWLKPVTEEGREGLRLYRGEED